MRIGDKIKKLRELKGLSQENVAEELSMSPTGYGRIERNEVDVTLDKLDKLSQILGMKVEDIITFDERVVFNNCTNSNVVATNCHFNNFPEKLQQLYEDKIKLLEEKVAWLEKK